ncbi:MAG: hypothetical protein J6N74_04625, partial [Chryseobacterium sp.]|nr:hypothetical protein [Chryseobacterium sp.]
VNHLAMEFKVSKDKIDTLKEYVIRTLKRTKKDHEKIRVLDDVSFKLNWEESLASKVQQAYRHLVLEEDYSYLKTDLQYV